MASVPSQERAPLHPVGPRPRASGPPVPLASSLTFRGSNWARAFRKAVGVTLLTIGLWGLTNYATAPPAELDWVHEERVALAKAKAQNRPLFIDFWARWCVPCKQLEAEVLSRPVRARATRALCAFQGRREQ